MFQLFKKIWQNRIGKIILLVLSSIVLVMFLIWYITLFNQKVIYFNGERLIQTKLTNSTQYKGNYLSEPILITVQNQNTGEIIVEYNLPNKLYFSYLVYFENGNNYGKKIRILEDNNELFNGIYNNNSPFNLLTNDLEPYFDNDLRVVSNNNFYPGDFKPSLNTTAEFATGNGVENRGKIYPLIMFFVVLIIYFIDIKFPLFFFTLHNFLSVKDPEPTEFYLYMQKLGWYVIYPIFLIVLLFMGI
ncbi:hypothetical protein [Lachnoclostridium phytofermentans]|uniref:Uncharacterized protein n=1 Tax=Lachnoclostridium phytofermentans (strain ATCC 700394 / DSM 18823 / ISDg) TaxID=357809 RepID=A9KI61_LACP7|nr:hypothetical protein [Lachnoclostridium phytofermentans]ABX40895.1 hypothetical protein Cphy_0508 [Lachnoclostridium phytofermentans ISDg]